MNPPAFADFPRSRGGRGFQPLSRLFCSLVAILLLVCVVPSSWAVQLLPGVYGYGTDRSINAAGFGAGAQVIEVTSLADSGTGTFRDAVTKVLSPTTAPRIIVFKTSGVIDLKTQVLLEKPNITIAGQTAPYPGVALHGAPLIVVTDNVLIQHLRMRAGDRWYNADITKNLTSNRDSTQLSTGAIGVKNVVFDHCTFAWSLDECVSAYNGYDNVTFNKCLFAEPLYLSIHMDEGIFNPNRPQQAQDLPRTLSSATVSTPSSTLAMSGSYQLVTASVNGAYAEYTLTIANGAAHTGCSIGLTGITGTDRGKFRIYVYNSGGTLLQTSNEMDMYAPAGSETQMDFIARGVATFDIPANPAPNSPLTYRVRVQVTAPNAANGGRNLGIDQLYVAQPHAMGPYFSDGYTNASAPYQLPGKLAMIGNAFAHMQARGPWVGAQHFYFANNVLYHRSQQMLQLGVATTWQPMHAAVIGNTFIEGREWNGSGSPIRSQNPPSGSQYYVDLGSTSPTRNDYNAGTGSPPAIYNATSYASDPTAKTAGLAGFVAQSTAAAYADVLLNAGARPNERDAMEQRVIEDIAVSAGISSYATRQGSLKNSVAEAGGWPVYAVNASTWTLPASPNGDGDSDGYTDIEEWLYGLAQALEAAPSAPPTAGALQAEAATLSGGAVLESINSGYAGSGYINFLIGSPSTPSAVTFPTVAGGTGGTRVLRFRHAFSASSPRTGDLVINGGTPQSISFAPTGSFATWHNHDATVTLNSGNNTVALRAIGNDLANLDEMAVLTPAIYQAETATYAGGALTETINAGYQGSGYVNFLVGSTGTPSVATLSGIAGGTGGSRTLRIRYALGGASARTGQLVINGSAEALTFLPSGAFTTWTTLDIPITLNSGSNTIAFRATGQDLANIDELLVY